MFPYLGNKKWNPGSRSWNTPLPQDKTSQIYHRYRDQGRRKHYVKIQHSIEQIIGPWLCAVQVRAVAGKHIVQNNVQSWQHRFSIIEWITADHGYKDDQGRQTRPADKQLRTAAVKNIQGNGSGQDTSKRPTWKCRCLFLYYIFKNYFRKSF